MKTNKSFGESTNIENHTNVNIIISTPHDVCVYQRNSNIISWQHATISYHYVTTRSACAFVLNAYIPARAMCDDSVISVTSPLHLGPGEWRVYKKYYAIVTSYENTVAVTIWQYRWRITSHHCGGCVCACLFVRWQIPSTFECQQSVRCARTNIHCSHAQIHVNVTTCISLFFANHASIHTIKLSTYTGCSEVFQTSTIHRFNRSQSAERGDIVVGDSVPGWPRRGEQGTTSDHQRWWSLVCLTRTVWPANTSLVFIPWQSRGADGHRPSERWPEGRARVLRVRLLSCMPYVMPYAETM